MLSGRLAVPVWGAWGRSVPRFCSARTAEKAKATVEWSRDPPRKARARPWTFRQLLSYVRVGRLNAE